MGLTFAWDEAKARHNLDKHGIAFEEAATVFGDQLSLTIADGLHSDREDRFVTIGQSRAGRLLVVVHTDRADGIRIISARPATPHERRVYSGGDHEHE